MRLRHSLLLRFREREQPPPRVDDAKKCAKLSALNVREGERREEREREGGTVEI